MNAGLGLVTHIEQEYAGASGLFWGDYKPVKTKNIGLPISVLTVFKTRRFGGGGIEVYTNLNTTRIFYGVNLRAEFFIPELGEIFAKKISRRVSQ